jgi:pSer/pThr/pTyr-binding forkhead associated (FHA) protein
MINLRCLSGEQAGSTTVARRFPFQIGRAQDSDLVLQEPGVWDRHLVVRFEAGKGFVAAPVGEALVTVNGENVRNALLRNGDLIAVGAARFQFWLSDTVQRPQRILEGLFWAGICLVTFFQVTLIYYLLR